jgi:CRISPR type I-A-associated protein Csa5
MMVASTSKEDEYKDDIARMLDAFVRCRMFSVVDKFANATSKVVVEQALYEALRISRAASESSKGDLCEPEEGKVVKAYVAKEESVKWLQELLRQDIIRGLEVCREIASRALTFPAKAAKASA